MCVQITALAAGGDASDAVGAAGADAGVGIAEAHRRRRGAVEEPRLSARLLLALLGECNPDAGNGRGGYVVTEAARCSADVVPGTPTAPSV